MAVGVGGQTRQSSNDPIRGLGRGWEPDLGWAQRPYTRYGGGGLGADAAVEQRPYTRLGSGGRSQTWGRRNDPIRGWAAGPEADGGGSRWAGVSAWMLTTAVPR